MNNKTSFLNSTLSSRNNEKRKEKSRDAARCRRSKETEIFTDLANCLPMKAEEIEHLDKASVMRLSISYLKVRTMVELCKFFRNFFRRATFTNRFSSFLVPEIENLDLPVDSEKPTDEDSKDVKMQILTKFVEEEKLALKALDGFLLVLNDEGEITYVSENIADILGLSKVRR